MSPFSTSITQAKSLISSNRLDAAIGTLRKAHVQAKGNANNIDIVAAGLDRCAQKFNEVGNPDSAAAAQTLCEHLQTQAKEIRSRSPYSISPKKPAGKSKSAMGKSKSSSKMVKAAAAAYAKNKPFSLRKDLGLA